MNRQDEIFEKVMEEVLEDQKEAWEELAKIDDLPVMTKEEIEAAIANYEQKFGMSSEEFLQRLKAGEIFDQEGIVDWKLLLKYR